MSKGSSGSRCADASERGYGTMPRWWPVLPIAAVALLINIGFFDAGIQYLARVSETCSYPRQR